MDYRVYRADIRFWMIVILLSCAVGGSAGYLFFDAWWVSVDSHMYPRGAKTAPSGLSAKADAAAENRIPGSDDAGVRKYQCRVFVGKCVCTDIPDERGGVPVDGSGTTDFDEWYCLS